MAPEKRNAAGARSWLARFLVMALALLALPAVSQAATLNRRIMGGTNANHKDYKFLIYLYNSADKTYCGGSIIDTNWIITAAHCIKKASVNQITVFIGQGDYELDMSKGTKIAAVHGHPQYNDQSMANDIALIKLQKPVAGKNVAVIAIDNGSIADGEKLTALGWGYTSPSGTKPSKKLQKGELTTISQKQCAKAHTTFAGNNGPQVCVAADAGPDTCPGDSGGPLIRSQNGANVLTGITSFGTTGPGKPITVSCGDRGMVSLFTHVKHYAKFIDSTTGGLRNINVSVSDGEPSGSGSSAATTTVTGTVTIVECSSGSMLAARSAAVVAALAALAALVNGL